MAFQSPTIREILKCLNPALAQQVTEPQYISGASGSLRAVQQGLGILRDRDEWATWTSWRVSVRVRPWVAAFLTLGLPGGAEGNPARA
jgi:hypothetical protein